MSKSGKLTVCYLSLCSSLYFPNMPCRFEFMVLLAGLCLPHSVQLIKRTCAMTYTWLDFSILDKVLYRHLKIRLDMEYVATDWIKGRYSHGALYRL